MVEALQVFGLQDHQVQFASSGNVAQREADLSQVLLLQHADTTVVTITRSNNSLHVIFR